MTHNDVIIYSADGQVKVFKVSIKKEIGDNEGILLIMTHL